MATRTSAGNGVLAIRPAARIRQLMRCDSFVKTTIGEVCYSPMGAIRQDNSNARCMYDEAPMRQRNDSALRRRVFRFNNYEFIRAAIENARGFVIAEMIDIRSDRVMNRAGMALAASQSL